MGFSDTTTRKLRAKLSSDHIRTRDWNGKTLSYIEGWHALSEANRIFGFDAWSRETVELKCIVETGPRVQSPHCADIARVRISVQAGEDTIIREGTGAGYAAAGSLAEAHALAAKEAETDATKRALSTFGNPFGLALYDREQRGVRRPKPKSSGPSLMEVRDSEGQVIGRYSDTHACALNLSKAFEGAETAEDLHRLWQNNNAVITILQKQVGSSGHERRNGRPGANSTSTAPSVDLSAAYNRRCETLSGEAKSAISPRARDNGEDATTKHRCTHEGEVDFAKETGPADESGALVTVKPANGGQLTVQTEPDAGEEVKEGATQEHVDKSLLTLPAPKRIRAPEHLKRVAQMPCLICQRRPSDAHHLKHAQPRAMARKPGDQWVVPLCRIHHRALHDAGDEARWWETQNVDAIKIAEKLWEENVAN